jgi:Tol biopolymer transport system component
MGAPHDLVTGRAVGRLREARTRRSGHLENPVSGGAPIRVTHGGDLALHWATGLSWSPDGKTIAFNSDRSGQMEVWTVAVDGGEPDRITSIGEAYGMRFSPDGQTIAFVSLARGKVEIWTVPSSGGAAEPLLDLPGESWSPSWSPDGTRLAFASELQPDGTAGETAYVWILALESGETSLLTRGSSADWSDSDEIAFRRQDGIWKVPASGGTTTLVAAGETWSVPVWSPDGKRISFVETGTSAIWIADISGIVK